MGCGRTGATLATEFEARGHTVAVIDQSGDAFRRLPSSFKGQRITGIGFDRDTLVSAGVEDAYGFAAVSDGDNSNILAARVVRETYGIENVVARIADFGRAEVYRRARQLAPDQEALLATLPAAERRRKPHDGLEMLEGV
ncbi:MAG: NAD-binding protein, partial [Gemmatimonadota bacterium]